MRIFLTVGLTTILLNGCASSSPDSAVPITNATGAPTSGGAESTRGEYEQERAVNFGAKSIASSRNGADATMAVSSPISPEAHLETYRIGPHDRIEIAVFMVPVLSLTVEVSENGTINLPLVGELAIAGKTAREFEKELTSRLKKTYLQNPQVNVLVREYNSQQVVVEGAVNKPGVIALKGRMSLLQAVALSQGTQDISDETALVLRSRGGKRMAARFDIGEIRAGKMQDPELHDGDTLVVGTSNIRQYVNRFMRVLPLAGVFALL